MINKNKKSWPLWGGHMSIADSIDLSFDRAESINTTAMQIFTKSNRQWRAKPLDKESIEKFKTRWKNSSVEYVNVHASYLINLASSNQELAHKSFLSLKEEVERCQSLGIKDLVLHPGSNSDTTFGIQQIASYLKKVLEETDTRILIENMAGQGGSIGGDFADLSKLLELTNHKNLGVCIDTCHAFAFGYELNNLKTNIKKYLGLENIKLFHLNGSLKKQGSRVDRHAHWWEGETKKTDLEIILNEENFLDIPKILETPKKNDAKEYIKDLEVLGKTYKYKIDKDCPLAIYQD